MSGSQLSACGEKGPEMQFSQDPHGLRSLVKYLGPVKWEEVTSPQKLGWCAGRRLQEDLAGFENLLSERTKVMLISNKMADVPCSRR